MDSGGGNDQAAEYEYFQALSVRCFRWRMGAGRAFLTLLPELAGQREHSLREVFYGLRYVHQDRRTLALDAKRPAPLGGGLSTGATLAIGGLL